MLTINDKGGMNGFMQQTPGYYRSYMIREEVKEHGLKGFLYTVDKQFDPDTEVNELHIDSLENFEEHVQINYTVNIDLGKENTIYLNPMLGEGYKENPFKPLHRTHPAKNNYAKVLPVIAKR